MADKLFIDASWKRWISENLLRGGAPAELTRVLVEKGFDEPLARLEVDAAVEHPSVSAAMAVVRQLHKRDWVMHNTRLLRDTHDGSIAELGPRLEPTKFFADFYSLCRPVVLRGAAANLPAIQRWTPEYLKEVIGDRQVEIQADRSSDPRYEIQSERHKQMWKFDTFVDRVFGSEATNDFYMTANNSNANGQTLAALWQDVRPVPDMLEGDERSGRMFIWMGPEGTVTPLHHDLTNNLMIQIKGRKRLKLIAPECLPVVYNDFHCYSQVDVENIDRERFPLFQMAKVYDVTIHAGDILFLPVGWWHHVRGLDATITVTYTNFRGLNQFTNHYRTYGAV